MKPARVSLLFGANVVVSENTGDASPGICTCR